MDDIHQGFQPGRKLYQKLDHTTPFRKPDFSKSIRGRSWALHDGVMGKPYTDITMYKIIDDEADISTFPNAEW